MPHLASHRAEPQILQYASCDRACAFIKSLSCLDTAPLWLDRRGYDLLRLCFLAFAQAIPQLVARHQVRELDSATDLPIEELVQHPVVLRIEERLADELANDLVVDEHALIETPRSTFADATVIVVSLLYDPFTDHSLVVEVKLSEIFPMVVVAQADVRDDVGVIVRVVGLVLVNNAHDPSDELDVGG